ncbi:MAG: aminotransferase class V-fold PLP-dependent enzyme [Candidatus Zixiibacteriota bacterium]|nr:MAG: aminotransferase class V-fold PLP-dependent enzyme [candidate division Zixibacteria bacterium]
MNSEVEKKFKWARGLFPVTQKKRGITYLNSGSTGPLCRPAKEALEKFYDSAQFCDRNADFPAFADLDRIRRLGAKIIGARKDEVGFGFHTGFGLNLAAFGLPLKRGEEVLLSDIEFPSNVYPWLALKQKGVKAKFIRSSNGYFDIENFKKAIGKKSRVLSLSFVQFFNGFKNDMKRIGEICKDAGLYFVVDGIQGCGVEPIDVHKCRVDIFSSGGQKWLLSPQGTGIFYVRKDLQDRLITPFTSWLSVDWKLNFTDLFHYDLPLFGAARRFEMGTYPYAHVHAMATALELITSLGVRNIQKHIHGLLNLLIDYIRASGYYEIVSNIETKHRSSILAFTCPEAAKIHKILVKSKIICALREGAIRISVHLFNDKSDIKRLISVLDKFPE